MESGATRNVLSKDLVQRLLLVLLETRNNITIATGITSPVVGILKVVPVKYGEVVMSLDFIVVHGSPLEVMVGDPGMEQLKGTIDLGNRRVRLMKDVHTVFVPFGTGLFKGQESRTGHRQ